MNFFKSHFRYNKSQRNGILFLIFIILILQSVYFFFDFSSDEIIKTDTTEIKKFQAQIDSLKQIKQQSSDFKIFPFNPNYLTDFKAYQLGLSVDEIDKLFAYRKTERFINSAAQFQEITGISDSLSAKISPYFKFPEWVTKTTQNVEKEAYFIKKDLNTASANELQNINGIGKKISKRIIDYRNLLKGYSFDKQLYEVYYLDKVTADKVLKQFTVIEKPEIEKLNLNKATFKEILHLPYIDYNLTKKIMNYKDDNGLFTTVNELKKIDSFPLEKYDRITLYLTAE